MRLAIIGSILMAGLIVNMNMSETQAAPSVEDVGPAPQRLPLYAGGAPGVVAGEDKDGDPTEPTIDVYLPQRDPADTKPIPAVVILPGGGYMNLATGHEGRDVARMFNRHGIAGFVVRYRHAPRYHHPIPMNDAHRAIRLVRSGAQQWHIDPARIGIMGFSAGGHLASTVSTKFDSGNPAAADPIDRAASRPDFAILCYPVITFLEKSMHVGSRNHLLGEGVKDENLVRLMSSELQVTPQTPPTFLYHTDEDTGVPPENSILYYTALRQNKVPAELHIFRPGRHGLGLAPSNPNLAPIADLIIRWMTGLGIK
jgi:acetyl esterase/lipase